MPSALARLRPRWLVLGVALLLVAALALVVLRRDPPAALTSRDVSSIAATAATKAVTDARRAPTDESQVYRAVLPSLVVVQTAQGAKGTGLGTGVIVNADGTILTAAHVVSEGAPITLTFADGTTSAAEVLERKPESDLAVLRPAKLPEVVVAATLGGGVKVGDKVIAIGNPLGLTASLSSGVVSATGRSIPAGGRTLKDLIQFDAAVNPGNSGGPLLDKDGRVVGIVTALANPANQPFFVGIGFAAPISAAGGAGGPSI